MTHQVKNSPEDKGSALLSMKFATLGDKLFYCCNFLILTLLVIAVLYPMIYVLACSFSSTSAVLTNRVVLWPVEFNLKAYATIFESTGIVSGFLNSVFYSIAGSAFAMTVLFMAAYPMSRKDMPGRPIFMAFFVVTMFFGGGMIPNYILVRNLGMMNRRIALIVPFVFSCYNLVIVRTFFNQNVPDELLEVSHIDGCGDIRFFVRIALPLSKPVIAVMALFHIVWRWNEYMRGLLYLSDPAMYPLQMVLREILFILQMSSEQLEKMDPSLMENKYNLMRVVRYSALVVGALPMMLMYPFIQKNFVRGMLIGSIKG